MQELRTVARGRSLRVAALAATAISLCLAATARAQDVVVVNGDTFTLVANTTIDSLNIQSGGTVQLNNFQLFVNDTIDTVFSGTTHGVINGSQLVKTGSGTVALDNYTQDGGEFIVVGGGLRLDAGSSSIRYLAVGSSVSGDATMDMTGGTLLIEGPNNIVFPSLQVGDFGGSGVFNQSGGLVHVDVGSLNVGNQGGTGVYNLSGGELRLEGGLYSLGRSTNASRNSDGTMNVSGTGLLNVVSGTFVIGDRDGAPDASTAHGQMIQTGGTIRFQAGAILQLAGANNAAAVDGRYDLLGGVLEIGGNDLQERRFGDGAVYQFNLGGGTIRAFGSQLTTPVNATLLAGSETTFDGNGLGIVWSGTLGGTGGLAKVGAGTLSLQNAGNGFTGGIRVEAGTLTATVDGAIPDGNAVTINGGTLDLNDFDLVATGLSGSGGVLALGLADFSTDQSASTTFAGQITGSHMFNKGGNGTLELTGISSFSGFTNVNAGMLVVNGSLASSDVLVINGARIGGEGTLGGLSINGGGTVAPGNSIGTLRVGSLDMNAAAIYEVEVDAAGNSDLIDVTNNAVINNSVLRVLTGAGTQVDTPYLIVDAGLVAGNGFTVIETDSLFLDAEQILTPTQVLLQLIRNAVAFGGFAQTPNQQAVAGALDAAGPGDPVADAVATLGTAAEAQAAFDALSGEVHASTRTLLLDDSRFLREAVSRRLEGDPALAERPLLGSPAVAWLEAFGSFGSWDGDGNAGELQRDGGGFFLGLDTALDESFSIGLLAGYGHSEIDLDSRASSAEIDTFQVALYGGARFGGLGLQMGGALAWHQVDASRHVVVGPLDETLTADYDAYTAQVFAEAGYRFGFEGFGLEPFANLAYVHVGSDGFTEQGGDAALSVDSGSSDALVSTLGLKGEAALPLLGEQSLTLRGLVGWRHSLTGDTPEGDHAFQGGSGFTVEGLPLAEDTVVVQAGFGLELAPGIELGINYSGQIGDGVSDQGLNATFRVSF